MKNSNDVIGQSINASHYSIILNNSDRVQKRDALTRNLIRNGRNFNLFVLSSIDFFYHDGSKQISILNDLMRMALAARGMNAARLINYLSKMVPHEIVEGTKKAAPKFGKKNAPYPEFDEVQAFITKNSYWYKFGAVDKTAAFNIDTYLELVADKCLKNNVTVIDAQDKFRNILIKRQMAALGQ